MKKEILFSALTQLNKANVEFISGKYFATINNQPQEINKIEQYISKTYTDAYGAYNLLLTSEIEEIKNQLVMQSTRDLWHNLPLVDKAKELGPINDNSEAPFELEYKQYIILNRLLYHPLDEVMFITTGVGGSGKSTFLNIIKQLFNNDVASIPLSELQGFMIAQATQHRLVASDEIGSKELNNDVLKQLISKQELDVNPKYGKPYHTHCQSNFFYCCNKAPKIDVTDTGILRRIVFYSRDTKIQNPNTSFNKQIYTEEQLLWFARRALAFEDENWFDNFKQETHYYLESQNSVYICKDAKDYQEYKAQCALKGLKAFSEPNWQSIKDLFEQWEEEDNHFEIAGISDDELPF